MKNFKGSLVSAISKNNSLLCVGLDPDWEKLPQSFKKNVYPQFAFNKTVIDQTHDLVCAYKPNSAFYEYLGSEGIRQLKFTCDYIHETSPEILILLDAKRADIASTSRGYVSYAFDYLRVDAITLHPYLGKEALQPFLDHKDKGCMILSRTSNPGAGEFQDLKLRSGESLYLYIARQVSETWNENDNCMLVVGATQPDQLKLVREVSDEIPFLIPGVGKQGGELESAVKYGVNDQGLAIINSSSGIIFAPDPRKAAEELKNEINKYRNL